MGGRFRGSFQGNEKVVGVSSSSGGVSIFCTSGGEGDFSGVPASGVTGVEGSSSHGELRSSIPSQLGDSMNSTLAGGMPSSISFRILSRSLHWSSNPEPDESSNFSVNNKMFRGSLVVGMALVVGSSAPKGSKDGAF